MAKKPKDPTEIWRMALAEGESGIRWMRRVFLALPSDPRCKLCNSPFRGIGGRVVRLAGFSPSRKNPLMCTRCFEEMPHGGAEVEVGVLFADVRGYTTMSEHMAPEDVAALMNRYYAVATHVLAHQDGVIDKLVGDEVMALFVPGFAGPQYVEKMLTAAEQLLRGVGVGSDSEPWLPVGVGLAHGVAFVGNVGSGEVKDFTALGDVVNTAARLQSQASAGQIVMSEQVYAGAAADRYPNATSQEFELKGKTETVQARIVDLSTPLVTAAR